MLDAKIGDGMTDAQKSAHIRSVVEQAGKDLRERHRWLKHQDAIGIAIMAFSLLGMLSSAYLYYLGMIAWWVCVPAVAIFSSFIHELEHDLIHYMYFRKKPKINSLMLIIGWLARPSTVNPLVRRKLHFHHHKSSGTESDLEERGITNGVPMGFKRLLMSADNMLSVFLRYGETRRMVKKFVEAQKPADRKQEKALLMEQEMSYMPVATVYYLAWHGYIVFLLVSWLASAMGSPITLTGWTASLVNVLDFLAIAWFLPNTLRTFSLHFISSNMHYYGDVEDGNVMQQTQVLNAWWLTPLQLFCFNFGSTHAIHHFLVKEPFYVRQWTAPTAHKVMREMGVRFNDFGTFTRSNRYEMT